MNGRHWLRVHPKSDGTIKVSFFWTIDNFFDREEENGQSILSPSFKVTKPGFRDTKWHVEIFPKGDSHSTEEDISLFLHSHINSDSINRIRGRAYFYIVDAEFWKKKEITAGSLSPSSGSDLSVIGKSQCYLRNELEKDGSLIPGGDLTVLCELNVHLVSEDEVRGKKETVDQQVKSLREVSQHLGKMLEDKEFCDIEIDCGGKVFSCHLNILSMRSPVFYAMFETKMKESESRKVYIEDIKQEIMTEMLYFIYTGLVKETTSKEIAGDLLIAADKYQLNTLKAICEDKLCFDLDVSNAVECLILGDMYQAFNLRNTALMMVAKNIAEIIVTDEYQRLEKHPKLALEIPKAMLDVVE